MQGVPWEVFWSVAGGLLGFLITMSFVLYKNVNRRIGEKYDTADKSIAQLHGRLDQTINILTEQLSEARAAQEERLNDYYKAHSRLRDKWEEFIREYLVIDSTRGQKVDALFRVVDQMRVSVEHIPKTMNEKIEDAFARSLSELKLYAQDQIKAAMRNAEGKDD